MFAITLFSCCATIFEGLPIENLVATLFSYVSVFKVMARNQVRLP
jgi:hypothetical protein